MSFYYLPWIMLVVISLWVSLAAFFWAFRHGQLADQERARYLPLRGEQDSRRTGERQGRYSSDLRDLRNSLHRNILPCGYNSHYDHENAGGRAMRFFTIPDFHHLVLAFFLGLSRRSHCLSVLSLWSHRKPPQRRGAHRFSADLEGRLGIILFPQFLSSFTRVYCCRYCYMWFFLS